MSHRQVLLAGTLVVALAAPAHAADTGVVNVSNTPDYSEGEEPLSVNPLNPDELVTVANVFQPNAPKPLNPFVGGGGFQDTRVYSTRDGGKTWITRKLDVGGLGQMDNPLPESLGFSPEFSDAFNVVSTDADSIWDRHGNAYFEAGNIHGIGHGGHEVAVVWRSSDGGVTWGPEKGHIAVNATDELKELDRPWFAVDNSGGPRDGTLYMTFESSPFVYDEPMVFIKKSLDKGVTWGPTVRVDDGFYKTQFNPRAKPVVGADGTIYVVYARAGNITVTPFNKQEAPIYLVVAHSTDGGETWEQVEVDGDVHRVESPFEATPEYTEMIPAIATDPARPGRVAVAWPEAKGPYNSRIVLRHSTDGGKRWSERIDVPDDHPIHPNQHDHVTLAWNPDGRLFVGWRDRRCCGGHWNRRYEQFVRVLTLAADGSFKRGRTVMFTDRPQVPATATSHGVLQPDEFQGLVSTRKGVSLTWSQNLNGLDELMYRRVGLEAWDTDTPACVPARRLVISLGRVTGRRIVRAIVHVPGRRARTVRGRDLRRVVVHHPPAGRFTARVVTTTAGGKRVVLRRRVSGCATTR